MFWESVSVLSVNKYVFFILNIEMRYIPLMLLKLKPNMYFNYVWMQTDLSNGKKRPSSFAAEAIEKNNWFNYEVKRLWTITQFNSFLLSNLSFDSRNLLAILPLNRFEKGPKIFRIQIGCREIPVASRI